ncbi:radical SAM protein [Peredibacter starrii]|uniref:Radical SAM protein n=1 Tax=Peredibacter starrii TaxID=28202 RepID=A0AAX4HJU9_9BACT|nr:radical SAM protein [Peredibacter starrii]WPU63531.1 radical SAM protein [Peredibacter starrii]
MIYNNEKIVSVGKGSPLTLSWELVTHCQFKCSYCYFNPYESSTNYSEVMKIVLTKIKNIKEPVEMTLLGGEPTLHPEFHHLIKSLYEMNHVTKIDVITNFQPTVEFWRPLLPYKDKIEIVLSYHVEYSQKNFFKKIEALKNDFNMNIIFLVHNELKYLSKLKEAADKYFELGLETLPITFAKLVDRSSGSAEYFEYQAETLSFLSEQEKRVKRLKYPEVIPVTTEAGTKIEINQMEFSSKNMNRFKGWKCQMNALIIHPDGMVSYPCTNQKKHILFAELGKRNLVCAHEICPCEAYWNFTKTKNS